MHTQPVEGFRSAPSALCHNLQRTSWPELADVKRSQALLKKSMPKALGHITSIKQLTELKLTPAPAGDARPADATSFQPGNDAPFICPVTELPLNGRFRAFVLRPSGLVVSERAIKEVSTGWLALLEHDHAWAICHPPRIIISGLMNHHLKDLESGKSHTTCRPGWVVIAH